MFRFRSPVSAMPSPFPGMDPYLEHPDVWPGVHARLIHDTAQTLLAQLRPRGYYADIGERVWLTVPRRSVYPDVTVARTVRPGPTFGGTAVAQPDEPLHIARSPVEVRQPFIDIYDRNSHRIVTGIEFVSPSNKRTRTGRRLYRRKQRETRDAGIHLVEIDLLRGGRHLLEVPAAVLEDVPRWDYLVNLARRGAVDYEVYPIRLRDRLPRIRVPLRPNDEDALLDLQAMLELAYDTGPYPERVDYAQAPAPPLADDDAAWADELLKEKRLR